MTLVSETLNVSTHEDGARVVVELEGELDLHSADAVCATVRDVLDRSADTIEVDAKRLTFIDSAGLKALLVAHKDAAAADVEMVIAKRSDAVDRILAMTGLEQLFSSPARL